MNYSMSALKWSAVGTALALSACATISPQEKAAYDQAQAEVQQLEADPLANQAAGKPLMEARANLANATAAYQHHDPDNVMYWSYLARRQAQIGEADTAELRARNEVAQANGERERVLLDNQRHRAEVAQEEARQAQAQNQATQQQLAQLQAQQQAAQQQQQLAQAQQQVDQARSDADQARAQAQQAEQARAQEQQTREQLEALQARETTRGMVLTLSGSLLFATGRDIIEPGALTQLQRVADFMQQHPKEKLRIEGFTDSRGSDQLNDALSQRRADAVGKALQADGVDPSRLEQIGRGSSLPIASNDSAAGRLQNRRVEIVFSNPEGEFSKQLAGN
jgi:outer membrane protein OmpA-like peptidoglycan-associated protein